MLIKDQVWANRGLASCPKQRWPQIENLRLFLAFEIETIYEGISKSFEPNMERARNLDLFCFIFQRSPLPTPHTCPI